MAWEEWERLKTDAAQRTRIDHVADPGGAPDLKASKGPWTKASGVAEELRTATVTALTDLTTAHDGAKAPGFTSPDALAEILPTWENRLKAVRDECGRLSTALAKSGDRPGGRGQGGHRRPGQEIAGPLRDTQKGEAQTAAERDLVQLGRNYHYLYGECGLIRTTLHALAAELTAAQKNLTPGRGRPLVPPSPSSPAPARRTVTPTRARRRTSRNA